MGVIKNMRNYLSGDLEKKYPGAEFIISRLPINFGKDRITVKLSIIGGKIIAANNDPINIMGRPVAKVDAGKIENTDNEGNITPVVIGPFTTDDGVKVNVVYDYSYQLSKDAKIPCKIKEAVIQVSNWYNDPGVSSVKKAGTIAKNVGKVGAVLTAGFMLNRIMPGNFTAVVGTLAGGLMALKLVAFKESKQWLENNPLNKYLGATEGTIKREIKAAVLSEVEKHCRKKKYVDAQTADWSNLEILLADIENKYGITVDLNFSKVEAISPEETALRAKLNEEYNPGGTADPNGTGIDALTRIVKESYHQGTAHQEIESYIKAEYSVSDAEAAAEAHKIIDMAKGVVNSFCATKTK